MYFGRTSLLPHTLHSVYRLWHYGAVRGTLPHGRTHHRRTWQELPILCYTLANQDSDEQAPILQYLLRNGCDPNAPDGYGCAPFWYATEAGHDAAASLLLCGALMGS